MLLKGRRIACCAGAAHRLLQGQACRNAHPGRWHAHAGEEADRLEARLGIPVLRHSEKKPGGGAAALEQHFGCVAKPYGRGPCLCWHCTAAKRVHLVRMHTAAAWLIAWLHAAGAQPAG